MSPTTPAKRVTRARSAANKTTDKSDALTKKSTGSKVAKTASSRKTNPTTEPPTEEIVETKRSTSRTTAKTQPLAAVPRRRIKVTPLDVATKAVDSETPKSADPTKVKKTARSKGTDKSEEEIAATEVKADASKARSRTQKSTTTKESEDTDTAPKARGRPKKATTEEAVQPEKVKATRQTRTRDKAKEDVVEQTTTRPTSRKKVTFQELPDDDKENLPIASKRTGTKKDTLSANGIKARPVRKPAATIAKKGKAVKDTDTDEKTEQSKALTPKRITQISQGNMLDESDGEDVLCGAKTPVRDLSLSPKRRPNTTGPLSPSKKLDFGQVIDPQSPTQAVESVGMTSPARRLPKSPHKNALAESPRRVNIGAALPSQNQMSNMNAPTLLPTSQSSAALLQSPKRGAIDSSMFQQSTIKQSKTPLKTSLLGSPARRLFSPSKQKTPTVMSSFKSITPAGSGLRAFGTPEDIAVSSHFRSSMSPQRSARVHRMSDDELAEQLKGEIDFDDSVLNIRSPLKMPVSKSAPEPIAEEGSVLENASDHLLEGDDDEDTIRVGTENEGIQLTEYAADMNGQTGTNLIDVELKPSGIQDDAQFNTVTGNELEEISAIDDPFGPAMKTNKSPMMLHHSSDFREEEEESSEDELAADETPNVAIKNFRSSLTGNTARSRFSASVTNNNGFTPLTAQLGNWKASSPMKKQQNPTVYAGASFSPIAAQHVPGEVQISRNSTPQSKSTPVLKDSAKTRKSLAGRFSNLSSAVPTPERPSYFADQMAATEIEQQLNHVDHELNEHEDLHDLTEKEGEEEFDTIPSEVPNDGGEDIIEDGTESEMPVKSQDLTTDLVNFTNASETALIDFANLAQEANQLAPQVETNDCSSFESATYGDENVEPQEIEHHEDDGIDAAIDSVPDFENNENGTIDDETVGELGVVSPDNGIEDLNKTPIAVKSPMKYDESLIMFTPVQQNYALPRFVNTVVSKVPLRPESEESPIKIPKKRSRSFSEQLDSAKRSKLGLTVSQLQKDPLFDLRSPQRRVRSAAPSPAHTTPGQTSFMIDDFGDSTLDGLEIPEDELEYDEETEINSLLISATPGSYKSVKTQARTPLKAVGSGVLHGAIVHVDVHTTEGADASGIFVELLTQMGAKCVKEWRWNPRASIGNATDDSNGVGKFGITHVVYKDGGKRTLEKVRDAKGEVWCVGVAWVLDCERENKWLDESNYVVDSSILPRGGSRRRKSMEPRMLINENGNISKLQDSRRSFSAEQHTKIDLLHQSTPVRRVFSTTSVPQNEGPSNPRLSLINNLLEDESEISSTYNSPTTTMNVKIIPEEENEEEEGEGGISTPTALINYDPRTAATPTTSTPYLMDQGKKSIHLLSCPPKQGGKSLFDNDDNEEEDNHNMGGVKGGVEQKKNKMKIGNNSSYSSSSRRKTYGFGNMDWKPKVRSPLGRN